LEDKLQHLLKKLAIDLRKEASIPLEKRAAVFVLHRARNLAHIISGALGKGKEPTDQDPDDDEDLEVEDVDEDALVDDSSIGFLNAEHFILRSNAMVAFKDGLILLLERCLASKAVEESAAQAPTEPE
jgi:hypothetical protein